MKLLRLGLFCLLGLVGNAVSAGPVTRATTSIQPQPKWTVEPTQGFVEDAMAFDGATQFAYIATNLESSLSIHLVNLTTLNDTVLLKLPSGNRVPQRLEFSADGKALAIIWGASPEEPQSVSLFAVPSGRQIGEVGSAQRIAVGTWQGNQALVLLKSKTNSVDNIALDGLHWRIVRPGDGKTVKEATSRTTLGKLFPNEEAEFLYWGPAMLSYVVRKQGAYDPKRDIRLPDQAVMVDALAEKVVAINTPNMDAAWHHAMKLRVANPGRTRAVVVREDLRGVQLLTAENTLVDLAIPVDFRLYEPTSLRQIENWNGQDLTFSLTVDPVNSVAAEAKRNDVERLDVYRCLGNAQVAPLAQIDTGRRRITWTVGSSHLAILRKLKGFSRGGMRLELYRLNDPS